ncbi:MAG: helix-turn-helix transcriptional regulator [Clostridia bacterium]|nr:helix-turn-helix transcriptional regulator [Clostridia bacterium]
MIYFAENLKLLRIEQNIGQEELARKIGVSKGIISMWENGLKEPRISSVQKIAEFFDITIDELVRYPLYK